MRDRYGRDPFMTGSDRQDNPGAAAVLDLHPGQAPGLHGRLCHNRGSTGRARREHPGPGPRSSPGSRPGRPRTRRPRANPWPGRAQARDHPAGLSATPADDQAGHVTAEAVAAIQVAGVQQAGCSERPRHHSSVTLSDTGGLRTRAVAPNGARLGSMAWLSRGSRTTYSRAPSPVAVCAGNCMDRSGFVRLPWSRGGWW